ncbi:MAG: histidine ammonia-lyase [Muribaculaceae bacterium]|nr:histidine ammonia-lyase [Muribaculaceae bacterium]
MEKLEIYAIGSSQLTYDLIEKILKDGTKLVLSQEGRERIAHCREFLDKKTDENTVPIYGVTTGFGSLCNKHISREDLTTLQENLVKSHSCSVGTPVDSVIVKLMLLLKAHALTMGFSGVQVQTVERIIDFYNNDALPVVYDRGSLGASGDLAPLANLFLPLIGEGEMMCEGIKYKSSDVLNRFGWKPIRLQSKEGLALLNGTQFMSANGIKALIDGWHLVNCFDMFGAMSLEAFDGRIEPFWNCIQQVRPHPGQIETGKIFRKLLEGSEIIKREKEHVQDPYSFRCIPQVHGAVKDAMHHVTEILHIEINSVTDNPTVFPDEDLVVSGGNFHGEPLALAFDYMGVALHELGNISERRVAQLILGVRGLPEFLVAKPGLNSGFMIPQYAAASMVSQNKMYAWPASCDSIVSSNGQEDLVSMGANAGTKLHKIINNLKYIAAIELMNAAQGIDFRRPLKSSPAIEKVMEAYREHLPFVEEDVVMADYIRKTMEFLENYDIEIEKNY